MDTTGAPGPWMRRLTPDFSSSHDPRGLRPSPASGSRPGVEPAGDALCLPSPIVTGVPCPRDPKLTHPGCPRPSLPRGASSSPTGDALGRPCPRGPELTHPGCPWRALPWGAPSSPTRAPLPRPGQPGMTAPPAPAGLLQIAVGPWWKGCPRPTPTLGLSRPRAPRPQQHMFTIRVPAPGCRHKVALASPGLLSFPVAGGRTWDRGKAGLGSDPQPRGHAVCRKEHGHHTAKVNGRLSRTRHPGPKLLLQTEYSCPPKIHTLKSYLPRDGVWNGGLPRWSLRNGIGAPQRRDTGGMTFASSPWEDSPV